MASAAVRREKVIRGCFRRVGWAGALRGQEILARTLDRKTDKKALREALEKEDAYTLHRPIRRRFPRRRVVVGGPYDQWQVDLVDVSEYADENGGVRYLLCCLDAFTRFAWVRTLKSKRASEVAEAFRDILSGAPEGPLYVMSDKGREFLGKPFADLLSKEGIRYFNSQNDDVKSCLVEIFQRTLQETVHRYFTARNTRRYVDVLQRLVTSYNATHHHSLGMSPRQALRADPEDVWYNLYEKGEPRRAFRRRRRRAYLEPGDHVRISKTKGRLPEKGYLGGWSRELFRVSARLKTTPVTYRISDASGEELKGSFYEQELGKAHLPDFFEVEKVLDSRERGGKTEYLVRWLGYPESFSSWTSDLVLLDGKKKKRKQWGMTWRSCCGQKCPRSQVVFLCQALVLSVVVLCSLYNLSWGRGDCHSDALWASLLSGCIGLCSPGPVIAWKWRKSKQSIDNVDSPSTDTPLEQQHDLLSGQHHNTVQGGTGNSSDPSGTPRGGPGGPALHEELV